jgi:predicted RNase H-like HicB family nuclease
MRASPVTVRAEWDAEARVWFATSDDVPGLVTEADTMEELMKKLLVMVPEVMELNNIGPAPYSDVPFELIAHAHMERGAA